VYSNGPCVGNHGASVAETEASYVFADSVSTVAEEQSAVGHLTSAAGSVFADVDTGIDMIAMHCAGVRPIPPQTVLSIIACCLYVMTPMDFVFDIVPIFGFIDDLLVIGVTYFLVRGDIVAFRQWALTSPTDIRRARQKLKMITKTYLFRTLVTAFLIVLLTLLAVFFF
jgi:uncharacterized membrane protein YkvA (DUF1232 family)